MNCRIRLTRPWKNVALRLALPFRSSLTAFGFGPPQCRQARRSGAVTQLCHLQLRMEPWTANFRPIPELSRKGSSACGRSSLIGLDHGAPCLLGGDELVSATSMTSAAVKPRRLGWARSGRVGLARGRVVLGR